MFKKYLLLFLILQILITFNSALHLNVYDKPTIVYLKCLGCSCYSGTSAFRAVFSEKQINLLCDNEYDTLDPIETQAEKVLEFIKNFMRQNSLQKFEIDLFGFSLGGITARYLIQKYDLRSEGIYVKNLATFGSPHLGTNPDPGVTDRILSFMKFKSEDEKANARSKLLNRQTIITHPFIREINLPSTGDDESRLSELNHIYLIRYSEEDIIKPPSSSWFLDEEFSETIFDKPNINDDLEIYDYFGLETIGIKKLFKSNKLSLVSFQGKHLDKNYRSDFEKLLIELSYY